MSAPAPVVSGAAPPPPSAPIRALRRVEDVANTAILVLMSLLPLLEIVGRLLGGRSLPGSAQYVSMLTLWIGFTGAMLAARQGRHLSLGVGLDALPLRIRGIARFVALTLASAVTASLAWGAWVTVEADQASTAVLPGGIPIWVSQLVMPIGYAVVAVRLILVGHRRWGLRLASLLVVAAVLATGWYADYEVAEKALWPGIALIVLSTLAGAPIYVALAGAATLLFWSEDTPVASIGTETLRLIKNPTMPTIPLFTFAGYVLAESKASSRLIRVTRALVGWMPGGVAIMTTLVCAFFTTFTGASGVTILALGGVLYPMLVDERYPDRFSVGLLTASGSIGLLFPPSLPVIFYAVYAKVPVDRMFVAGLLPGVILVVALASFGVFTGVRSKAKRTPFDLKEAGAALWAAKWEAMLPVIPVAGIVFGLSTPVEAAALTAVYAIFIEGVVHKDLSLRSDLVRVAVDCATLIGGVLIILGVALGFTSYLVDAEVPAAVLEWVKGSIESRFVFLIALNLFLLVVGCLMDIFSAIVVIVPLIAPISEHFGVSPVHLGIIFLANLELGFLTPPVGMNLFLASYRFEKPLPEVYRTAIPFLIVLIVAVLLITYWPALSLAPVEWLYGEVPKPPPIRF
jgi:C4-dicarboxylate transporter DctM subunit